MKQITLVCILMFLCGCMFEALDRDLAKMEGHLSRHHGQANAKDFDGDALILLVMRDAAGEQPAMARLLPLNGEFNVNLETTEDNYIFVFNDTNRDFSFQEDEPYGWANNRLALPPAENGRIAVNVYRSQEQKLSPPSRLVNRRLEESLEGPFEVHIGTLAGLQEERFSAESSKQGLWRPYAFTRKNGAGVYFLEPYDPKRIPVLFIHGINGSPRNFDAMIASLDTSRYQAWVFSYPSGLQLSLLSSALSQFIGFVDKAYELDELHLVAHSMGGLVTRGAIRDCIQRSGCDYLKSFTSFSTPWAGVQSAQQGVKWSPTVVPVWRDMDPESEYLADLFAMPLPPTLPHFLFFGYKSSSILGGESGDGVIALTSMLRPEAQYQSSLMRGYNEDHIGIIKGQNVIDDFLQILDLASGFD